MTNYVRSNNLPGHRLDCKNKHSKPLANDHIGGPSKKPPSDIKVKLEKLFNFIFPFTSLQRLVFRNPPRCIKQTDSWNRKHHHHFSSADSSIWSSVILFWIPLTKSHINDCFITDSISRLISPLAVLQPTATKPTEINFVWRANPQSFSATQAQSDARSPSYMHNALFSMLYVATESQSCVQHLSATFEFTWKVCFFCVRHWT